MSQIAVALIILVITVVLFIWEPIPIIVTAIGASIAFAYTGLRWATSSPATTAPPLSCWPA